MITYQEELLEKRKLEVIIENKM